MGRLPKKGIDYFSHDVNASLMPTLYTVQQYYGNDGYAFWFKLLEYLGTRDNLSADFSDKKQWLYFVSIARVDSDKGEGIMSLLASIGAIDEELWEEHRIVWSEHFAERAAAVYTKRGNPAPQRPDMDGAPQSQEPMGSDESQRVRGEQTEENAQEKMEPDGNAVDEKKARFSKPSVEEIAEYCAERENTVDPQNFFDFYESKGWKVGNQPMKDWKACVRTWERRENKRGVQLPKEAPSKYNREE